MFYGKIKSSLFLEYITSLMVATEEINILINNNGFHATSTDVSNVCMITSELNINSFEIYEFNSTNDSSLNIGIDLKKISSLLNSNRDDSLIEINISHNGKKINFKYDNVNYSSSLLDLSLIRPIPKIPNVKFIVTLSIFCNDIKKSLKTIDKISDYVLFEFKNNNFYLKAKNETDEIVLLVASKTLKNDSEEQVFSIYSTDYLESLVKTIDKDNILYLSFSTNYPLMISYSIKNNSSIVKYFLAPRIENE